MTSAAGAVIGASVTAFLSRGIFQTIFGSTLLVAAAYLLIRPQTKYSASAMQPGYISRQMGDAQGITLTYSFSLIKGLAIAFGVGFISCLLPILNKASFIVLQVT
jgi:uncharacterized membrane protein YfcA